MAKPQQSSNLALVSTKEMSPSQPNGARRRNPLPSPSNGAPQGMREINAAPILEGQMPSIDPNGGMTVSRAVGKAGVMINAALPAFMSWGLTMGLIFGGCCSNVFALEVIVKEEPESGFLITFTQFVITALFAWPKHFSASNPPWFLETPAVPLVRWIPNILLFFTVNMLNNFAFGYNISVPVHIILRSGGSVTTILVGWIWGKTFSRIQVFSVAILTVGVIIAGMSDAQSKGNVHFTPSDRDDSPLSYITGLTILFVAQALSAVMGLYTQFTYSKYGPHWPENLFYSHFLSLPLFLPFLPSLRSQFIRLLNSPPITFSLPFFSSQPVPFPLTKLLPSTVIPATISPSAPFFSSNIPSHLIHLVLNALTQYACIRGVNLLGARTSALGVTIVLNVRKLISLFASIWLFGNELPLGVMFGAIVVFIGGGVYAWEGSRSPRPKAKTG